MFDSWRVACFDLWDCFLKPFWNVDAGHSFPYKIMHKMNFHHHIWHRICSQRIAMVCLILNLLWILQCSERFLLDLLGTGAVISRAVRLMFQRLTQGPQFESICRNTCWCIYRYRFRYESAYPIVSTHTHKPASPKMYYINDRTGVKRCQMPGRRLGTWNWWCRSSPVEVVVSGEAAKQTTAISILAKIKINNNNIW